MGKRRGRHSGKRGEARGRLKKKIHRCAQDQKSKRKDYKKKDNAAAVLSHKVGKKNPSKLYLPDLGVVRLRGRGGWTVCEAELNLFVP